MKKACIGFNMKDAVEAYYHMDLELVEEYGSQAYGNILHTWDAGGEDSYYKDYFPVDSPEEAEELNRKYNGFDIEFESGIRFMIADYNNPHWSIKTEDEK